MSVNCEDVLTITNFVAKCTFLKGHGGRHACKAMIAAKEGAVDVYVSWKKISPSPRIGELCPTCGHAIKEPV